MKYLVMNALKTDFADASFSVGFDKGTLDALMSDDSEESIKRGKQLFSEVSRVLNPQGKYICVSLLQEHILKTLINYFFENKWDIRIERCSEAEQKAVEKGEAAMPVFVIICSKTKKKSKSGVKNFKNII